MSLSDFTSRHALLRQQIAQFHLQECAEAVRQLHNETALRFGEDSPEHAQSLLTLGNWHAANGDYTAAEPILKQAVQIVRHHNHSGSLNELLVLVLRDFGRLCYDMYQVENAFKWHEEALSLQKTLSVNHNHVQLAAILCDLASDCFMLNQVERAQSLYEQSAAMYEKLFGMQHSDTARVYSHLAVVYRQQGYASEALSILKKTIEIQKDVLKYAHPRTAFAVLEYASTLDELGQTVQASTHYQEAIRILRRVVGEQHPLIARALLRYAVHHLQAKRPNEALPLLHQALDIILMTFDESHPVAAYIMQQLVVALVSSENEDWDDDETDDNAL